MDIIFAEWVYKTSEVQTDIMPGILQKLSDELHIDFEVAEFETTWPESIPWDDILRGSNISHVSYCLLSFFTFDAAMKTVIIARPKGGYGPVICASP
jgi:hypothetical protein